MSVLMSATEQTHGHGAEGYVRLVAESATPRALTTREVEETSAANDELRKVMLLLF